MKQRCPICKRYVNISTRHPCYLCRRCVSLVTDKNGNIVSFSNTEFSGHGLGGYMKIIA